MFDRRHLNIGIDGRPLQGKRRGDGRYVFEFCRRLDKHFPEADFFIYSSVPIDPPVRNRRWHLRIGVPLFAKLPPLMWLKIFGWYHCRMDRLDLFWGTNVFLPLLDPTVKKVITVHDICFKITPETFSAISLWTNRLFFMKDLRKADSVSTVSRGTTRRIARWLTTSPTIVSPAVNESFKAPSKERIRACRRRYGLNFPYLLNVSAWEPRKNVELLATTFLRMKKDGCLPGHLLVLAGRPAWRCERLIRIIAENGNRDIVYIGFVPDAHLPALYAGADVFVFPSIYEGFGMPVLEARACGTPVVTTDIPELREAGGPDAIYVTPTEKGIRQGILEAVANPAPVVDRADLPTWEKNGKTLSWLFKQSLSD
jgi:glycosyltransferase involved in cell wall biosynthesis